MILLPSEFKSLVLDDLNIYSELLKRFNSGILLTLDAILSDESDILVNEAKKDIRQAVDTIRQNKYRVSPKQYKR